MVSTASSGRRRIPRGLRMMAGGEGGGCEMEGEIGEGAGSGAGDAAVRSSPYDIALPLQIGLCLLCVCTAAQIEV